MSEQLNSLNYLNSIKPLVFNTIKKYLPNSSPQKHYEIIADYPNRQGKYFRPGLVLLSTQMYGGNTQDALLPAAAVQISEDWLLIHDDVEDHSEERRNKPTLNVLHGPEVAINAGDALHVIMWQIVGDITKKLEDNRGYTIHNLLAKTLLKTIEGQYLDLSWIHNQKIDISEEEYLDMITRKTCHYTAVTPIQIGAIVTNQSPQELEKITEYAIPFGYAFQIWDDCMNLTSTEQGKELAGDIDEGKRTLILAHLLQNCTQVEKELVISIYKKNRQEKTKEELSLVLKLMHSYGSVKYAQSKARNYSKQALEIFSKNTSHLENSPYKSHIQELISFVVNRVK